MFLSLFDFTQFDGEGHPFLGKFLELAVVVDLAFHFFDACGKPSGTDPISPENRLQN